MRGWGRRREGERAAAGWRRAVPRFDGQGGTLTTLYVLEDCDAFLPPVRAVAHQSNTVLPVAISLHVIVVRNLVQVCRCRVPAALRLSALYGDIG